MRKLQARPRPAIVIAAFLMAAAALPAGPAFGYNRNDVFAELNRVPDDWTSNEVSVHIGDDEPDPGVLVGDPVTLTVTSALPAHFVLVMIDSKGEVAVIAPSPPSTDRSEPSRGLVYPPPGTGALVQGEPVGMQAVYLFATERPVPLAALGVPEDDDFAVPGRDPAAVAALADALSDASLTGRRSVARYRYLVDSDVELGTRAVRRELGMRVQQVDVLEERARDPAAPATGGRTAQVESAPLAVNDIRFETNSARLTPIGRVQLDVIGSELLRRGESGDVPAIALEGHTDDTGAADYNEALSRRRAEAARGYLVDAYGLESGAIAVSGRGEASPRVPNVDAKSRALNRRVEIRVVR